MDVSAALVPEVHPPVRPAMYVAVGVPPPLDTDTPEAGRSARVGSTSSDVLPQVQLPAASYTTASTGIPDHTCREPDRIAGCWYYWPRRPSALCAQKVSLMPRRPCLPGVWGLHIKRIRDIFGLEAIFKKKFGFTIRIFAPATLLKPKKKELYSTH